MEKQSETRRGRFRSIWLPECRKASAQQWTGSRKTPVSSERRCWTWEGELGSWRAPILERTWGQGSRALGRESRAFRTWTSTRRGWEAVGWCSYRVHVQTLWLRCLRGWVGANRGSTSASSVIRRLRGRSAGFRSASKRPPAWLSARCWTRGPSRPDTLSLPTTAELCSSRGRAVLSTALWQRTANHAMFPSCEGRHRKPAWDTKYAKWPNLGFSCPPVPREAVWAVFEIDQGLRSAERHVAVMRTVPVGKLSVRERRSMTPAWSSRSFRCCWRFPSPCWHRWTMADRLWRPSRLAGQAMTAAGSSATTPAH